MTRPRIAPTEFERITTALAHLDELPLDEGTATRLLSGQMPPEDAPQAQKGTAMNWPNSTTSMPANGRALSIAR